MTEVAWSRLYLYMHDMISHKSVNADPNFGHKGTNSQMNYLVTSRHAYACMLGACAQCGSTLQLCSATLLSTSEAGGHPTCSWDVPRLPATQTKPNHAVHQDTPHVYTPSLLPTCLTVMCQAGGLWHSPKRTSMPVICAAHRTKPSIMYAVCVCFLCKHGGMRAVSFMCDTKC